MADLRAEIDKKQESLEDFNKQVSQLLQSMKQKTSEIDTMKEQDI